MNFKEVILIVVVFSCFACIVSNETVQLIPRCKPSLSKTNLINFGERSEASGYKVLHDFNFPDVTYPTTALESCQPFYFNSNGLDAIVGPFSSDVQSNYRSLLSPNENKIKDATTKKSNSDDKIQHQTLLSNVIIDNNKTESENVLQVVRKLFKNYVAKNHVDTELKDIMSVLFGGNLIESESFELNELSSVIEIPALFRDDIKGINITTNQSIEENMTESIELLIDRLSESNKMNYVIEELMQLLDKSLENNEMMNQASEESTIIIAEEYIESFYNSSNSDSEQNLITQPSSNEATHYNLTSTIQLELELTKEDIEFILLNSTSCEANHLNKDIDDFKNANGSIYQNFKIEPVRNNDDVVLDPQLTILSIIEYQNVKYSDFNVTLNKTRLESEKFNINKSVEDYKVVNNPIDSEKITTADSTYTDEIDFHIPKDPVVYDVVYRDAYNLDKPLLDIVPSSIPVRLKINIEILKHDSNEIDDFCETDLNYEQFSPRTYENNINLENVSNSIENTEEDLTPEEQITVLDEINESDFINALSILLLDSLNNNPLEIIPSEFINSENNSCNFLMDYSAESPNYALANNINLITNIHNEPIQPIPTPEITLPIDSNKEQSALELNFNTVKYSSSPLIEMISNKPVITADQLEDVYKYNITEMLITDNLKANNNESETLDIVDNIRLENKNMTQDISISNNAGSFVNLKEEIKIADTLLINRTDTERTWPLIDVFQLKIRPFDEIILAANPNVP